MNATELDQARILIVDDEPTLRMGFEYALKTEGFSTECAQDGEKAIERLVHGPEIDAMILDLRMPGKDGIEVLREMRERNIFIPTILASAFVDSPTAIRVVDLGVVDFLRKPTTPNALRGATHRLLDEEAHYEGEGDFPLNTADEQIRFIRCCLRRGEIERAHDAMNTAAEPAKGKGLAVWKFMLAHLYACHLEEDNGEPEFASSQFYRSADLLGQLAYQE